MAPLVPLESEDQCHLAVAPPLGSSTWILGPTDDGSDAPDFVGKHG